MPSLTQLIPEASFSASFYSFAEVSSDVPHRTVDYQDLALCYLVLKDFTHWSYISQWNPMSLVFKVLGALWHFGSFKCSRHHCKIRYHEVTREVNCGFARFRRIYLQKLAALYPRPFRTGI